MDYKAPRILFNAHLQTIYPSLLRRIELSGAQVVTIPTQDEDFLELDHYKHGGSKCVIISHGLEGNSRRAYVLGMARVFFQHGFDVIAWNYRGCGSSLNKQLRFYHSGDTDDLRTVVNYASKSYPEVVLVGFSLGGNVTLKYLGEPNVNPKVIKGVAISVPIDLHASCLEICKRSNFIYSERFLRSLKQKVLAKAAVRNDLDVTGLEKIRTLIEFDDHYTAPLHGFRDAVDYYTRSSSIHFLSNIRIPTLLINARNDPFLSSSCFPEKSNASSLLLEYPEEGGHVGFTLFSDKGVYWSEMRALSFVSGS